METTEREDLLAYCDKLRAYSTEELEDIYFHIHILRHPVRYRLVVREMEARKLRLAPAPGGDWTNVAAWIGGHPRLARRRLLAGGVLWLALFGGCLAAVASLYLPFWFFAVVLHLTGVQAALVYVSCAPMPALVGASVGRRMGARGLQLVPVLAGVAGATYLFIRSGVPGSIVQSFLEHQGGGGWGGTPF